MMPTMEVAVPAPRALFQSLPNSSESPLRCCHAHPVLLSPNTLVCTQTLLRDAHQLLVRQNCMQCRQQYLPLQAFLLAFHPCSSWPCMLPSPIMPSHLTLRLHKISQLLDCEIALFSFCVSLMSCYAGTEEEGRGCACASESCNCSPGLGDGNVSQQQCRGREWVGHGQPHLNFRVTQGPMKEGESCMHLHAQPSDRHVSPLFCAAASLQDLVKLRTVLHMWSQLSCSFPSHLLCSPGQLRAGEGHFPPLLTLCFALPPGEGKCWLCIPRWWTQLFLGSAFLPTRMMRPSGPEEEEEECCAYLLYISLLWDCFLSGSQAGLHSPIQMVPPRRMLLVSWWESTAACRQQKAGLMTFSCLISWKFRYLVLTE